MSKGNINYLDLAKDIRQVKIHKTAAQMACEIPHAPVPGRKNANSPDKELDHWRAELYSQYPLMSPLEVARDGHPFYLTLLRTMLSEGDTLAAHELNTIFRKEDREKKHGKFKGNFVSIKDQKERILKLAETLKLIHLYVQQERYEKSISLRKQIGEKFMHSGDIWLAKHFFLGCLQASKRLEDHAKAIKIQAETHCLLAFLARENNDTLDSALALAIDHLAICRSLSREMTWQFKPRVLTIKLKKPIALHGMKHEEDLTPDMYDIVDGCSMTIYMIATLLEHELLISLANQIMHTHEVPTEDDMEMAHEFADHALRLALEVRQPTALSSALVRFGLVLKKTGAYQDALNYFEQLRQHAMVHGDHVTEAIAYHNLGLCHIGLHNSFEGLECFAKQMDIASEFQLKDLEADAMYEVGHLLLQEGYLWESEECYTVAHENFDRMDHNANHKDSAWAFAGISSGHKLFARYASLCRSETPGDLFSILEWKCARRPLNPSTRPRYKCQQISQVYGNYVQKMRAPKSEMEEEPEDIEAIVDNLEFSDSSLEGFETDGGMSGEYEGVWYRRSTPSLDDEEEEGDDEEEEEEEDEEEGEEGKEEEQEQEVEEVLPEEVEEEEDEVEEEEDEEEDDDEEMLGEFEEIPGEGGYPLLHEFKGEAGELEWDGEGWTPYFPYPYMEPFLSKARKSLEGKKSLQPAEEEETEEKDSKKDSKACYDLMDLRFRRFRKFSK